MVTAQDSDSYTWFDTATQTISTTLTGGKLDVKGLKIKSLAQENVKGIDGMTITTWVSTHQCSLLVGDFRRHLIGHSLHPEPEVEAAPLCLHCACCLILLCSPSEPSGSIMPETHLRPVATSSYLSAVLVQLYSRKLYCWVCSDLSKAVC